MFSQEQCEAELDRISAAYARRSIAVPINLYDNRNLATLYMSQERDRATVKLLRRHAVESLSRRRILDVGCGTGSELQRFVSWGAVPEKLVGIDLMPDRIATARRTCPAGITLLCGSAHELPFSDASFDLAIVSTVFSSILDEGLRTRIAEEIRRVLCPGGNVLWYDFWLDNPGNADVRGISAKTVRTLFQGFEIHLQRITVAPYLARKISPYSHLAYCFVAALKVLSTHQLGIFKKL